MSENREEVSLEILLAGSREIASRSTPLFLAKSGAHGIHLDLRFSFSPAAGRSSGVVGVVYSSAHQ